MLMPGLPCSHGPGRSLSTDFPTLLWGFGCAAGRRTTGLSDLSGPLQLGRQRVCSRDRLLPFASAGFPAWPWPVSAPLQLFYK